MIWYKHIYQYIEGDKVRYQYQDLNTWLGLLEVIYHKDNKVWLYNNSNIEKLAPCKVKLYELIERKEDHNRSVQNCDSDTNAVSPKIRTDLILKKNRPNPDHFFFKKQTKTDLCDPKKQTFERMPIVSKLPKNKQI